MNQNRSAKLSKQDRDMEKFIRFFALKAVQAIVQARLGEKKKTRCKTSSSSNDWFHVTIEDHPEIQAHARDVLCNQNFLSYFSMCVEISLKTAEGDSLVLETWCLLLKEPREPNVKHSYIYSHMTLLLKSILAVARVTPAYKLSSRQCSDSYVILYRIYFGQPQNHLLGEGFQENKIGEIKTTAGCLVMSVAYRTVMAIKPQKVEKESPFMVKSDYFQPDMSPKKSGVLSNGFHLEMEGENKIPEDLIANHISCPVYCGHGKRKLSRNSASDSDKELHYDDLIDGDCKRNSLDYRLNPGECKMAGAFAPATKLPDPTSFPDLLLPDKPLLNLANSRAVMEEKQSAQFKSQNRADSNANLNLNIMSCQKSPALVDVDYNCNANDGKKLTNSASSECEDFVMVELRPPFADSDSNNDLGAFFRECRSAPPLASFASQPTLEKQVTDITGQLAMFETSMPDFDSFVDTICQMDAKE